MMRLLELLVVALPLTALSVVVGGHAVEPAWVLAAGIALLYFLERLARPDRAPPRGTGWALAVLLFVGLGLFALAWSPYATRAAGAKGAIQAAGILCALGTALAVVRCVEGRPERFARLVRLLVVVLFWVAAIGLAQFVLFNVLRLPAGGEFEFLNSITGNPKAWRYPGQLGGIVRVNSIAAEPAHLAQYLATVSGLVWLRLGALGRSRAEEVRAYVSRGEAAAILLCAVLTLSLVGWGAFLVALVALVVFSRRISLGRALPAAVAVAVAAGAALLWIGRTERALGVKLATIPTVLAAAGDVGDTVDTPAISAIAVLGNRVVTAANLERRPLVGIGLGAHPESFAAVAPQWEGISAKLNAEDASGLLLRLLSETGVVGATLFVGVWALVLVRARRRVLSARVASAGAPSVPPG
ncbi:MAG: hypothetical protein AB1726_11740, partial [Planctomycetota bacterium]